MVSKYGTFINAIMVDAIKKREGIVSSYVMELEMHTS